VLQDLKGSSISKTTKYFPQLNKRQMILYSREPRDARFERFLSYHSLPHKNKEFLKHFQTSGMSGKQLSFLSVPMAGIT
jgi:hypothetical protein